MAGTLVKNANYAKRFAFGGSSLPSEWSIVAMAPSHSVQVTAGALRITDVTPTANAETIVRCKVPIKPRCRAKFLAKASAAAALDANRQWALELVSADGQNYASLYQQSATATTYGANSAAYGQANTAKSFTSWPSLLTGIAAEMRINIDQLVFSGVAPDAAVVTLVGAYDSNFPDDSVELFAQIRLKNGASAPGGAGTYLDVQNVSLFDFEPMNVSIHEASGVAYGGAALPVYLAGGATQPVSGTVTANGGAALDAAMSGNPTVAAARGSAAIAPAMSADGDVTAMWTDRNGRQHVLMSAGLAIDNLITNYRLLAAASTNDTLVAAGAHRVYSVMAHNTTAAVKFLKLYNKATAPASSDTPVATIPIPANGNVIFELTIGMYFALGLGLRITGAVADADTTAVAANDVIVNMRYC